MKRSTPMKRTPFRRKEGPTAEREKKPMAKAAAKPEPKEGACAWCDRPFLKLLPMQKVCGPVCAGRIARADREAKKKAEREQTRERKQALKTVAKLKAEAQDVFNDYIRERDADLPCVSCGVSNPPKLHGGQWDAGHFLSRGAYPELAFDEDNCHKQCKSCNAGSGKYPAKERTVRAAYEEELLRRIGPERVARLKGPHEVKPLERDELIALKAHYRAKTRELTRRKEE